MKTLVKGCIVEIDAAPFAAWYEKRYGVAIGKQKFAKEGKKDKKGGKEKKVEEKKVEEVKLSHRVLQKREQRRKGKTLAPALAEQFQLGRLLARISSRPGQCGRADGYILEGPELEFYQKKIGKKKSSK
jgi:small subunit ribosomal protein S8e